MLRWKLYAYNFSYIDITSVVHIKLVYWSYVNISTSYMHTSYMHTQPYMHITWVIHILSLEFYLYNPVNVRISCDMIQG